MRDVVEMVLALVSMIVMLGFVLGMLRPKWVRQESRGGVGKVYGLGTLACFVVVGLVAEPVETVGAVANEAATEAEVQPASEPDPEPQPEPAVPAYAPMRADVAMNQLIVRVTNANDYPWRDCEVRINPGLLNNGWTQSVAAIAPGETIESGLMAFTRSGGERFNPATHAVETIAVSCRRAPDEYGYVSFDR